MSTSPKKLLGDNSQTEKRFSPYCKASSYIRHLNNIYELAFGSQLSDEAYILSKVFQKQLPKNSEFKVSLLPKAYLSKDLSEKSELVNIFQRLSDLKPSKKKISIRSGTPMLNKLTKKIKTVNQFDFKHVVAILNSEKRKKCNDCKRRACECLDKTKDQFLKKMFETKGFKNCSKTIKKMKNPKNLSPVSHREADFFISQRTPLGYTLFQDESNAAIQAEKKNKFLIPFKKSSLTSRRKIEVPMMLDTTLNISSISYSERPKTKDH